MLDMDIEDNHPFCAWDWVKVFDGYSKHHPVLGNYCGTYDYVLPPPVTSTGKYIGAN